ncbi:FAD-binding oxidoreductase [Plantactinospora sp. BB1]|nr:FAD-binding oxidoreductase [Plantactinospora sp. BB1]
MPTSPGRRGRPTGWPARWPAGSRRRATRRRSPRWSGSPPNTTSRWCPGGPAPNSTGACPRRRSTSCWTPGDSPGSGSSRRTSWWPRSVRARRSGPPRRSWSGPGVDCRSTYPRSAPPWAAWSRRTRAARSGTCTARPCDQLVGVSYVDASGVLAHARAGAAGDSGERSGQVPADPDVARLLCGSQGALGVLVSATLRVQPIPASRGWVVRSVWTPLEVHDLVRAVLDAELRPTAIEVDLPGGRTQAAGRGPRSLGSGGHLPPDGPGATGAPGPSGRSSARGWFETPLRPGVPARPVGGAADRAEAGSGRAAGPRGWSGEPGAGTLAVLLEGGPAEVAERAGRLTALLGGDARAVGTAPGWWRRYPFRPDDVALRIEVPIGDLHAAVYALRDAAGAPVPVRGSAGLGVVHAALPSDSSPERVGAILDGVRAVLRARSGRCVVVAAPPRIREAVDLWGELPDLPLLRRVKERFDPARRLAPGRYPGGI